MQGALRHVLLAMSQAINQRWDSLNNEDSSARSQRSKGGHFVASYLLAKVLVPALEREWERNAAGKERAEAVQVLVKILECVAHRISYSVESDQSQNQQLAEKANELLTKCESKDYLGACYSSVASISHSQSGAENEPIVTRVAVSEIHSKELSEEQVRVF